MSLESSKSFSFFGSSRFSVIVLDELERSGLTPKSIITTPDKRQGRHLILTPTLVKDWGLARNIKVYDPERFDDVFIESLKKENVDVFVVASYGKIIPENIIGLPKRKTLNIHPSLLPLYRGASPLQSAVLADSKHTGVTIMRIDEKMDHGPIVAQKEVNITEWSTYDDFEYLMAKTGTEVLAQILPDWIDGKITEKEQDHSLATYTNKISKEDGLIDLESDPYENFRKIQAYNTWPQAYFIFRLKDKNLRIKITSASFEKGKLIIEKVIPEGSKEMTYTDFARGYIKKIIQINN